MPQLHDMHCHLDFMTNAEEVAREAQAQGTLLFANTVSPEGWLEARERFAERDNVSVGFGMHPWWVEPAGATEGEKHAAPLKPRDGEESAKLAARQQRQVLELLEEHDPAIIGEVGLDFGWQHEQSRTNQLKMFEAVMAWAAPRGGKLISIHSVRAARETMETLESSGAARSCMCIFHWFTGPSDLLKRAVQMGCYFSCGPRMLKTGKGREYAKAIPADRLLLETDAPPAPNMPYSFSELRRELESAADSIAQIKGQGALELIAQTSEALLSPFTDCRLHERTRVTGWARLSRERARKASSAPRNDHHVR